MYFLLRFPLKHLIPNYFTQDSKSFSSHLILLSIYPFKSLVRILFSLFILNYVVYDKQAVYLVFIFMGYFFFLYGNGFFPNCVLKAAVKSIRMDVSDLCFHVKDT